jgi:hypothetical protein
MVWWIIISVYTMQLAGWLYVTLTLFMKKIYLLSIKALFFFNIYLYFINKSRVNIKFLKKKNLRRRLQNGYDYKIIIASNYCF